MSNGFASHVREMSWKEFTKSLSALGWQLETNKTNLKKFRRGSQIIALVKVGKKKWKTEYFLANRLVDSAGINDEEWAKIIALEFGILRTFRPNPF